MSILRGHEDLQPKTIVGFDMGFALVECEGGIERYRLAIGPRGNLTAHPAPSAPGTPIDQIGESRARRRFHDVDQPIQ